MNAHDKMCANWHAQSQAPIDTLRPTAGRGLCSAMERSFREALLWHMKREGTRKSEIVSGAGVSRDVVNKLCTRVGSSTNAEDAVKIANFYGKTLDQFLAMTDQSEADRLIALWSRLGPDERRILEAQIRALAEQ